MSKAQRSTPHGGPNAQHGRRSGTKSIRTRSSPRRRSAPSFRVGGSSISSLTYIGVGSPILPRRLGPSRPSAGERRNASCWRRCLRRLNSPRYRKQGQPAASPHRQNSVIKPVVVDRRAGRHQAEIKTDDHVSFRKPRMPTPEASPINSPPSRRKPPRTETSLPAVEAGAGFRFQPPVKSQGVEPLGPDPVPTLSKATPAGLPVSAPQPVAPALDAEGGAKPSVASVLARALSGAASSLIEREHDLAKVATQILPVIGDRSAIVITSEAPPRERETALAKWIDGARAAGIAFSPDATAAVARFRTA